MRGLAVGIAAWAVALTAAAQSAPEARSLLVECLQPAAAARVAPVYPEQWLERKEGGTWTFELVFEAPDSPPRVVPPREVPSQGQFVPADFVRSVRDYARQLRMPCLPAGETARLRQDFAFLPNGGRKVGVGRERDEDAGLAACSARQADGSIRPRVPFGGWHGPTRQAALLSYTFAAAGEPPTIQVLAGTPTPVLTDVATDWAKGLRLTCAPTRPQRFVQLFIFRMSGTGREVLRDLPLVDFLRAVRNLDAAPVYFDFATMGCPFAVQLDVMQPYSPNRVSADGAHAPQRQTFLDWLARLVLNVPERDLNAVLGQTTNITVPCGTLDL